MIEFVFIFNPISVSWLSHQNEGLFLPYSRHYPLDSPLLDSLHSLVIRYHKHGVSNSKLMTLLFLLLISLFLFVFDATAGGGGKGTWGKLLTADGQLQVDRNDPNYDSGEVCILFLINSSIWSICISI